MALSVGLKGTPTFHHLHLKTPLPPTLTALQAYPVTLFLSNEMDLWIPDEHHAHLLPLTVSITTSAKHAAHPHPHLLPSLQVLPPSKPLVHRNGRGAFDLAITSTTACCSFYIHFSVLGSLASTTLTAVTGPHSLQQPRKGDRLKMADCEVGEVEVWHSFAVPSTLFPHLLVRELCGTFIGGRVWDCALYLMQYVKEEMLAGEAGRRVGLEAFVGQRMVELGSGTGVFGLWLYLLLNHHLATRPSRHGRPPSPTTALHCGEAESGDSGQSPSLIDASTTSLLLTDQPEAMELLRFNLDHTLTLNPPTTPHLSLTAAPLLFGHQSHLDPLTPSNQPAYSLLLASDVVFNPAYFTALLRTLCHLLTADGRALMAYRPRGGVEGKDDVVFWKALKERGMRYSIVKRYANVFIVWIERSGKHPPPSLSNIDEPRGDG